MKFLFVIPARGGSKGIPHKNIKPLNGKPLIEYSIDIARQLAVDTDICVSTDADEIISVVENHELRVPFKRPDSLATDTCGTYDVLLHAVSFYESCGRNYDAIVLLQPTSPFRTLQNIQEAMSLYSQDIDMVAGVKEASSNPYYNCFEENDNGFLAHSKEAGIFIRRQDVPKVWEYNGAVYIINISSLKEMSLSKFGKVRKYVMNDIQSLDLDSMLDWKIAEMMIKEGII